MIRVSRGRKLTATVGKIICDGLLKSQIDWTDGDVGKIDQIISTSY